MKRLFWPLVAVFALNTQLLGSESASVHSDSDKEALTDSEIDPDFDILDTRAEQTPEARRSYGTRYPIVFVHGFMGWDEILNVDYFYHVRKTLEDAGYQVFTPIVNPINSVEVRARQLAPKLDEILRVTKAEKLNVIAHSMGGLDMRYLINHGYAERVASLTTIGTPHHGTPVPDLVFRVLGRGDNLVYKAFEYLVNGLLGKGKTKPSDLDLRANLWNLSSEFMEGWFNPNNPDSPDIYYQSYAGVSSLTGWKTGDRLDILLTPFQLAFKSGQRNDGMVPEESAKWGRFRGCLSADHIDLIGQLLGSTSSRYQHLKFYRTIADELADLGY